MINKILSMIGLAAKAGCVKSGEFAVEQAIKSNKAFLVIIAKDASDNTRDKFENMCKYRKVPIVFYSRKEELGHLLGKEYRASLAIIDENFAKGIQEKISNN